MPRGDSVRYARFPTGPSDRYLLDLLWHGASDLPHSPIPSGVAELQLLAAMGQGGLGAAFDKGAATPP